MFHKERQSRADMSVKNVDF